MSTHYSQKIHFFYIFMISLQNICFFLVSLIHVIFCGFLWIMWISRCISPFLALLRFFFCGQNVHTFCGQFFIFSCPFPSLCIFTKLLLTMYFCYFQTTLYLIHNFLLNLILVSHLQLLPLFLRNNVFSL